MSILLFLWKGLESTGQISKLKQIETRSDRNKAERKGTSAHFDICGLDLLHSHYLINLVSF